MIVVVAVEDDIAADAVVRELEKLGRTDVFRVDLENAHRDLDFSMDADTSGVRWKMWRRAEPERVLHSHDVEVVYWRRTVKSPGSPLLSIPTSAILDQYEVFWSLRWALESLPHRLFPLGHNFAFAKAENKYMQLQTALQVGFRIPRTRHANEKSALREFIASQEKVAIKALRVPAIAEEMFHEKARHIACKGFTPSALLPKLDEIGHTQLHCQEAIERKADLRIMVFPHTTIAAEIDTTKLPDEKLDWREHSFSVAHRIVPLEPAFEAKLRAYLAAMDLKAGFFDFAVPEDGDPIFFECNTNAQWYWIEMVTGHPIAAAIAQELLAACHDEGRQARC